MNTAASTAEAGEYVAGQYIGTTVTYIFRWLELTSELAGTRCSLTDGNGSCRAAIPKPASACLGMREDFWNYCPAVLACWRGIIEPQGGPPGCWPAFTLTQLTCQQLLHVSAAHPAITACSTLLARMHVAQSRTLRCAAAAEKHGASQCSRHAPCTATSPATCLQGSASWPSTVPPQLSATEPSSTAAAVSSSNSCKASRSDGSSTASPPCMLHTLGPVGVMEPCGAAPVAVVGSTARSASLAAPEPLEPSPSVVTASCPSSTRWSIPGSPGSRASGRCHATRNCCTKLPSTRPLMPRTCAGMQRAQSRGIMVGRAL